MVEPIKPVQTVQKQAEEQMKVPKQFSSMNESVRVTVDGPNVTIDLHPAIVQEVGAYHRCKVQIKFVEGKSLTVVPIGLV